jgi:cell filamentation protein, protein adenylyltransferase
MDPARYVSTGFGRATTGGTSFVYFAPAPMPRRIELSLDTVMALSAADNALGRLASAGHYLKDPALFVRPYMTREALASSRIEGTRATLSEVLQAEAVGDAREDSDVREVQNYIAAFDRGLQLLREVPISQRLVSELHGVLMRGVRGRDKRPGNLRDIPVFVGSPTNSAETAAFVPPLPPEVPRLLSDWEQFANEPPKLPVLIQSALLHYQFETIHPYLDGNGRLGRLLIVLHLREHGLLPAPLLYVSAYLEERRQDYYDRLQAVREKGEINEWIQFFLTAVTVQSQDAVERAEALFHLRESYRTHLAGSRSRATEVVDLLFENPFVTTRSVSDRLSVSVQGALNLIRQLERQGWLRDLGTLGRGRGGRVYWVANEVFDVLEKPRQTSTADAGTQLTLESV